MKSKYIFGLSCAGGGAHGAYQVGVLKYIHQHFSDGQRSPFQIFTGSSCGALNTTFYSAQSYDAYKSRAWLEELWLSFHVPAYHGNIFKNAFLSFLKDCRQPKENKKHIWSLLDPSPMEQIVSKGFKRENLIRSLREGSTLGAAIAATEIISGRTCWFQEGEAAKEWNVFHSIGLKDHLTAHHLQASCSVPIFLPPVKIGDHYFLDGSISLIKPLNAAIIMGANRILSIATEQDDPRELPRYRADFRPQFSNVIRLLLGRLSHDAAAEESKEIEAFNRFYLGLAKKHLRHDDEEMPLPLFHEDSKPAHYHETEIFRLTPSKRIRISEDNDENDSAVPRRKTRFMFHESFIKNLIQMGYDDASKRHEDLKKFFLEGVAEKRWFFFREKKLA